MQMISHTLLKTGLLYTLLDLSPYVGPCKNLADLFIKTVVYPGVLAADSTYGGHLISKSLKKCVFHLAISAIFTACLHKLFFAAPKEQKEDPELQNLLREAKRGHLEAMTKLGCYYMDPHKGSDFVNAAGCFQKAALKGHKEAIFRLAWLKYWGAGLPLDKESALQDFKELASAGYPQAFSSLGRLSPLNKAEEWYKKGAEAGDIDSMLSYALILVKTNPREAGQWLKAGAERGDPDCMACYANMIINSSPLEAEIYRNISAELGSLLAKHSSAKSTLSGSVGNLEQEISLYNLPGRFDYHEAVFELKKMAEECKNSPAIGTSRTLWMKMYCIYLGLGDKTQAALWHRKIFCLEE